MHPGNGDVHGGGSWPGFGDRFGQLMNLMPLSGPVADGVNGLWYLGEGDALNAGLSVAAAIPFVGWAAAAGKAAKRAGKSAEEADAPVKDLPRVTPPGKTPESPKPSWATIAAVPGATQPGRAQTVAVGLGRALRDPPGVPKPPGFPGLRLRRSVQHEWRAGVANRQGMRCLLLARV